MTKEEALKDWLPIIRQSVKGTEVYEEALEMAIKALEQEPCEVSQGLVKDSQGFSQEPCEDVVSRSAVLEAIDVKAWEFCDYLIRNGRNDEQKPISHFVGNLRECVREELPSVTPQQKVGQWEWVQYDGNPNIGNWNCSECHSIGRSYFDYCPVCGCKMQEVEE